MRWYEQDDNNENEDINDNEEDGDEDYDSCRGRVVGISGEC